MEIGLGPFQRRLRSGLAIEQRVLAGEVAFFLRGRALSLGGDRFGVFHLRLLRGQDGIQVRMFEFGQQIAGADFDSLFDQYCATRPADLAPTAACWRDSKYPVAVSTVFICAGETSRTVSTLTAIAPASRSLNKK